MDYCFINITNIVHYSVSWTPTTLFFCLFITFYHASNTPTIVRNERTLNVEVAIKLNMLMAFFPSTSLYEPSGFLFPIVFHYSHHIQSIQNKRRRKLNLWNPFLFYHGIPYPLQNLVLFSLCSTHHFQKPSNNNKHKSSHPPFMPFAK